MTTFKNYRFQNGPLETNLKQAIKHYYKEYEVLPPRLVVHPKNLDQAKELAQKLALNGITIEATGGCQLIELWLEK